MSAKITVRLDDRTVAVCNEVRDSVKHHIAMRTALQRKAHFSGNTIDPTHCFAGETRYLTDEGVKTLAETVNTTQWVLTADPNADGSHGGRWVQAHIHEFGEQKLYAVTLRRNKQTKVIHATDGHRWLAGRPGKWATVTTDALQPNMRLAHLRLARPEVGEYSREWTRQGIFFGDGSCPVDNRDGVTTGRIELWGEKAKSLAGYFDEFCPKPPIEKTTDNGVHGLSFSSGMRGWQKIAPLVNAAPADVLGWLSGYFAADGSVDHLGVPRLSCSQLGILQTVRDLCTAVGIGTYGITSKERQGYGDGSSVLHTLAFVSNDLDERFFLREPHSAAWMARAGGTERFGWTVTSVAETDRFETVYCAVVPGTEAFVLEDNILTKNCPFCGSGAIFGRSDGTIECDFCTAAFTIQIQPLYPAYPMTDPTTGEPMPYPGQPDPAAAGQVDAPEAAVAPTDDPDEEPGASVNGATAPPFGGGGKTASFRTATGAVTDWDGLVASLAAAS